MHRFSHVRRRVAALALVLAASLLCASPAFAWGPLGHRIVARLAEAQLSPRAAAEAKVLLAVGGHRYLDQVANWADDLRDTDPALFQRTRRDHFVNFRSGDCIYRPPRDCRRGQCAVAAIQRYSAILADRGNSPAERAEALAFVVHLVADVHQPLHAGYRHDAGGNDFRVRWNGRDTNLHKVWDSLLLDSAHLSTRGYVARLAAETSPVAAGGTPADWAEESCRLDRDDGVYPRSHAPGPDFIARERPVAEMRLRQAAARLAALLDRDLANG